MTTIMPFRRLIAIKRTMNDRSKDIPPKRKGGTNLPTNFIGGSVTAYINSKKVIKSELGRQLRAKIRA